MAKGPRAGSISVKELSSAVQRAVDDVLGNRGINVAPNLAFGGGTLIGRQMRSDVADLATVERAATEVTARVQEQLGEQGASLRPAAFLRAGEIIVGFVPEGTVLEL